MAHTNVLRRVNVRVPAKAALQTKPTKNPAAINPVNVK